MEFRLSHTGDNTASNFVKSNKRYDQDSTAAYHMGSNPKGYMLIIKHSSLAWYDSDSERDAQEVQNLFLELGYIVMQKRVWFSKDFMEVIEEFIKFLHNCTMVDSIFIYVITCNHNKNLIYDPHLIEIEGEEIPVETLLNTLANNVSFNGKPKVILSQTTGCREVSEKHFRFLWNRPFSPPPDCLLVSYLEQGIYITTNLRSMCDKIRIIAHKTDLEAMLTAVERNVHGWNKDAGRFSYFRVYSTSFKKLYFNPGLYDQTPYECQTGDNTAIKSVKSDRRYDQDSTEVYLMGENPKGYLLIIKYQPLPSNDSDSDRDAKRLQEVFPAVGYIVLQKRVLCSKDLMKGVEEFKQFLHNFTEVDSVFIYIINYQTSSSNYPQSIEIDREKTGIDTVMRVFANDEFFNGKPKVLFDHSTGTPDLVTVESSPALPEDWLVVSSYQRDNYSDVEVSICVDAICNEITETADNTDLETMMRNVEKNLGDKPINDEQGFDFKVYRTSFKKLYFNPGLYDQPPSCSQSDTVDSMQGTANDSIPNNPLPDETVKKEDCQDPEDVLQPIEIIVRKSEQRLDKDESKTYKMGSKPKGYALVISNEKFKDDKTHKERIGGDKDRDNLDKLLRGLGYEVTVEHNLTKDEMELAIISFRNKEEQKNVDSTIVFILTHGVLDTTNDHRLITSDDSYVRSEWIIQQFYGKDCPNLIGKPKLFFFQCCRGTNIEKAVPVGGTKTETDGGTEESILSKADFLIVYACAPGNVALRSPTCGSWFVHFMCKVFTENAHDTDVIQMLNATSRQIKKCVDPAMSTQVMCYTSQGLDKSFYFNPGLYDN